MAIINNNVQFFYGEEARKQFQALVPQGENNDLNEVSGMMAMPGKVEGTAFVFSWDDNLDESLKKLPKDAILIAGQTRPQIVLLIRRCRGIITDEGGTMSHAAIVAREFKMPCIVGTRNATKVFKTGQKITLNATNGVAKIRR
jgi:pyruvate,water dikinase